MILNIFLFPVLVSTSTPLNVYFRPFPFSSRLPENSLPRVPVQITWPLEKYKWENWTQEVGSPWHFLACPTNLQIWQSAFSSLLPYKWAPMVRCVFLFKANFSICVLHMQIYEPICVYIYIYTHTHTYIFLTSFIYDHLTFPYFLLCFHHFSLFFS